LGKDTAWNTIEPVMWIIFVLPTLVIAFDFVMATFLDEVSLYSLRINISYSFFNFYAVAFIC
jgi:hypothetical protein